MKLLCFTWWETYNHSLGTDCPSESGLYALFCCWGNSTVENHLTLYEYLTPVSCFVHTLNVPSCHFSLSLQLFLFQCVSPPCSLSRFLFIFILWLALLIWHPFVFVFVMSMIWTHWPFLLCRLMDTTIENAIESCVFTPFLHFVSLHPSQCLTFILGGVGRFESKDSVPHQKYEK